jgi:parallel beta-helix repeat protein
LHFHAGFDRRSGLRRRAGLCRDDRALRTADHPRYALGERPRELRGQRPHGRIAGNEVRGGGDGIGLLDSDGNSVARNNVHDLPGSGIILDEFGGDGSDSNTVADNSVARTGSDGFFVGGGSAGNHLQGNLSTRGGANGFLVTTAGNRLSSNTASYNHLRGIDAIAGTVDGGGNRAFGNGLSPQCVGVSCA